MGKQPAAVASHIDGIDFDTPSSPNLLSTPISYPGSGLLKSLLPRFVKCLRRRASCCQSKAHGEAEKLSSRDDSGPAQP